MLAFAFCLLFGSALANWDQIDTGISDHDALGKILAYDSEKDVLVASASGNRVPISGSFNIYERDSLTRKFQRTATITPMLNWTGLPLARPSTDGRYTDGPNFGYGLAAGHGIIVVCAQNLGDFPDYPNIFVYQKLSPLQPYTLVRSFRETNIPSSETVGFAIAIWDPTSFIVSRGNGAWYTTVERRDGEQRNFALSNCPASATQQILTDRPNNRVYIATVGCIHLCEFVGGSFNFVKVHDLSADLTYQNFGKYPMQLVPGNRIATSAEFPNSKGIKVLNSVMVDFSLPWQTTNMSRFLAYGQAAPIYDSDQDYTQYAAGVTMLLLAPADPLFIYGDVSSDDFAGRLVAGNFSDDYTLPAVNTLTAGDRFGWSIVLTASELIVSAPAKDDWAGAIFSLPKELIGAGTEVPIPPTPSPAGSGPQPAPMPEPEAQPGPQPETEPMPEPEPQPGPQPVFPPIPAPPVLIIENTTNLPNLTLNGTTVEITGSGTLNVGTLNLTNSTLILNSGGSLVVGNTTLQNSTIIANPGAQISVSGCADFRNASLIIPADSTFTIQGSCISPFGNVSVGLSPDPDECQIIQQEQQPQTGLTVVAQFDENCNEEETGSFPIWAIVVVAVVMTVILAGAFLVLFVKSIRQKVFPYSDLEEDRL